MFNSIHRFCEKRFQKLSSYELMDGDQKFKLIQQCKHLKHIFNGVFAADNFPLKMSPNSSTIVNASSAASIGTHWVVLVKRYASPIIYFADPLALPIYLYKHICDHLKGADTIYVDFMEDRRENGKLLQCANSQLCGLICTYIAHYLITDYFPYIPDINKMQLLSFVKHSN